MKSRLLCLALVGCQHTPPAPLEPIEPSAATYEAAAARLMLMLDDGWVVSRLDGAPADQGDSLFLTGLAMGALDCERGAVPEAAFFKMLEERQGGVYRHPSIPDDYSLDGLLALWWGVDHRASRCPEVRERWAAALPVHAKAISVEPFFGTVLQEVMARLGTSQHASLSERGRLGSEIVGWADFVVSARKPAYRLHLGWLALDLVDAPQATGLFCSIVKPAKIAVIEHFCGREALSAWIDGFAYDRFTYAFQRAAWETEDPGGKKTPPVDLLVALSQAR